LNSNLKKFLQFIGSFALGGTILFIAAYALKGKEIGWPEYGNTIADGFKQTNYWWIGLSCVIALISHFSRSLRWRMLISPLGKTPKIKNTFFAIMIAYLVNLAIPRGGEIARCGIISGTSKVPFQKLLGTAVADRIFDLIVLVLMLFIGLLFAWQAVSATVLEPLIDKAKNFASDKGLLIGIALVAIVVATYFLVKIIKKSKFWDKIKNVLAGFKEGFISVKKLDKPWLFILHTVIIWVCYMLMIYVCFKGFPPTQHLGLTAALVTLVLASFGMVVPSPGGAGTFQIGVIAAIVGIYGVDKDAGASFSLIVFIAQQGLVIVVGLISFILLPLLNKKTNNEATAIN